MKQPSSTRRARHVLALTSVYLMLGGFDWAREEPAACRQTPPIAALEEVARFDVPNANQGVGVDERHFYAIDNTVISKHDKRSGREVGRYEWKGAGPNPLRHLDSAVAVHGKLFCAHSNYPEWPMTSSVEVWDTRTMKHIGTHSFGIRWGSLTWLDWHQGHWWAVFANYNVEKAHPDPSDPNGYDVLPGDEAMRTSVARPYGYKRNTVMVKLSKDFMEEESWTIPDELLTTEHTGDMSISGGSFGPDGLLTLSGHDGAEIYQVKLPEAGSQLQLVSILPLRKQGTGNDIASVSIRGQGIAWDRGTCSDLYGIIRTTAAEKAAGTPNKVTVSRIKD